MPSINGDQPELDGSVLQGMVCTQHWPDGTFDDAANVIYFRVHNRWHRLYFDFGTVFWRSDVDAVPDYPATASPDEPFVNVDFGSQLSIVDRTISSCITDLIDVPILKRNIMKYAASVQHELDQFFTSSEFTIHSEDFISTIWH